MRALAFAIPRPEPDGQIIDVDIEINAVPGCMPYPLANLDPGVAPPMHGDDRVDLQTLMTHEFGHFLGLAHTCAGSAQQGSDDGDGPPPGSTDSDGQPIPTCTQYPSDTEAVQAAAVMWYEIAYEDTAKRVLTSDDARGVCAIYPAARAAPSCTQNSPDDGCGCAAAGDGPGSLIALAVVALVLARRRRRPV